LKLTIENTMATGGGNVPVKTVLNCNALTIE